MKIKTYINQPIFRKNPIRTLYFTLKWFYYVLINKNKITLRLFKSFSVYIFFNKKKLGVYGHTYIYRGNISEVIPYAISKYLDENDNFIDVGANFGLWSLFAAKINVNAKVYSFEPVTISYNNFVENIKLNNTNNIIPNKFGLSNKNEELEIYIPEDLGSSSIVSVHSKDSEKIKLKKLDNCKIKNVKVIKVDVEGFEAKVLEGAKEILKVQKPIIIIEIVESNLKAASSSPEEIFNFFTSVNYRLYDYINNQEVEISSFNSDGDFIAKPI